MIMLHRGFTITCSPPLPPYDDDEDDDDESSSVCIGDNGERSSPLICCKPEPITYECCFLGCLRKYINKLFFKQIEKKSAQQLTKD